MTNKAKEYTDLDFKQSDFLHDCIQAVCLLIRDGLDFAFSHRSFQEYFTAVFLSQVNSNRIKASQLEKLLLNFLRSNEVADLLFEISPELLEKHLIIPKVVEFEKIIEYKDHLTFEKYSKILEIFFTASTLSPSGFVAFYKSKSRKLSEIGNVFTFIRRNVIKTKLHDGLEENSYFFQKALKSKPDYSIEFEHILENENLKMALSKGNHWLSLNCFQRIFDIKKQLVEKHKKQEMFLEEELFE